MDKLIEGAKNLWNGLVDSQKNSQEPAPQQQQPQLQTQLQTQPQQPAGQQQAQTVQQPIQQPQIQPTPQPQPQPQQQPQQSQQPKETTPPKMDTAPIVFGQEASQIGYSQDKRNQYIASNLAGQYKQALEKGTLNDTTRDQILMNTIQQYGGKVDWNSPDWINTVDDIYKKTLPRLGGSNWKDLYNGQSKYTFNKPVNELVTDYEAGKITDQDLEKLKLTNPDAYNGLMNQIDQKKQQDLSKLNTDTTQAIIKGDPLPTKGDPKVVSSGIEEYDKVFNSYAQTVGGLDEQAAKAFDNYRQKINSADRLTKTQKLNDVNSQIETLDQDLQNLKQDLIDRYGGTMSSAMLNSIIADKSAKLVRQRSYLVLDANKLQNELNSSAQLANQELASYIEQNNQGRESLKTLMNISTTAYSIKKDQDDREDKYRLMQYQFDLDVQKDAAMIANQKDFIKRQKTLTEGDIKGDPEAQMTYIRKQVNDILAKYEGIPIQRSPDQIAGDVMNIFKKNIAKGMNSQDALGQALSENLVQPIQGKPEFKYWVANKNGIDLNVKPMALGSDLIGMPDGQGGWTFISKSQQSPLKISDEAQGKALSRLGAKQEGEFGGQCGRFANNYLTAMGEKGVFGDLLSQKKSFINSNTPSVGAIAISSSSAYPNNGHVSVVTRIGPNGEVYVTDSNAAGDQTIKKDHLLKGNIFGYYVPKSLQGASAAQTGELNAAQEALAQAWREKGYVSKENQEQVGLTTDMYNAWIKKQQEFETKYDMPSLESKAFNLGGGKTMGEGERKDVYKKLRNFVTRFDPEQAVYRSLSYDVNNWDNFSAGLVDYVGFLDASDRNGIYPSLAKAINNGDKGMAVNILETKMEPVIKRESGDKYLPEAAARVVISQGLDVRKTYLKVAQKYPNYPPTGPIQGWLQDIVKRFKDNDAKLLMNRFGNLNTEFRHTYAGSNVTENETKALVDMLPSLNDDATAIKMKIDGFMRENLRKINAQRAGKLPQVTYSTLLDPSQRWQLYQKKLDAKAAATPATSGNSLAESVNKATQPAQTVIKGFANNSLAAYKSSYLYK